MIDKYLSNLDIYKSIIDNKKVNIKSSSLDFIISCVVSDYSKNDNTIFLVLPNLYEAQKAYDRLTNILNEEYVLFYPGDELVAAEILNVSGDFKYERINTIISLLKKDRKYIVVMNVNSLIKYQLNKSKWKSSIFQLHTDLDFKRELLIEKLSSIGYKKVYTVTKTGEFASRGEIIDIFPLNFNSPIRIDYFDDTIDTIKEFDIESQKSIRNINNVEIIPVNEIFYDESTLKNVINKINEFKNNNKLSLEDINKIDSDILDISLFNTDNLNRYIHFFENNTNLITDFVDNKKIYYYDFKEIIDVYDRMYDELTNYCTDNNSFLILKLNYFIDKDKLLSLPDASSEGLVDVFKDGLEIRESKIDDLKGIPEEIVKLTKELSKNILILPINNELRLNRLKDIFLENSINYEVISSINNIKKNKVNIIYGSYFPTLSILNKEINIVNEDTLFEYKYNIRRPKYKSIYKNTSKISHYNELKEGDYVVHFDYGIGLYNGLKTIDNNGIKRDYLEILYDSNDKLFVPLEQISRIEKYNVGEVKDVKLTKIRTGAWERAKEKVRKKVHDISDKLIKLYASRSQSEGFKFEEDSELQMEFESKFNFDLTLDQAKAISDVKADMESNRVMDRLICGDVGYGKTEVALRAAFKAVNNAKQVALLCPTTILAQQHYLNFKNRMEEFGVRVELVNRFIKPKKQKEIFKDLLLGKVDILIGTHRILSDEIKYKDLGLLIIDEEQRFGVLHKEKLRQLKVNVDTITLSATPIPRTLQMSIAGIKDLSMIETPPKNRYPIQTYVLERNDSIIRDAILREMARGGQVYYMYNLVDSIESVANKIHMLVPDARIAIGHGKMEKNDLENVINDFINKKYDVLVCTTIIETGIDIPDCNTLIIHDSNRLGLSQLYQLRGRVGRSDRIAYSYMMYEPKRILTEEAKKRLEAIKEFNELGSGYKIAMRDLAIRGAGDILGDEQSGFVTSVGLETYLEILNEEIDKIKNPKKEEEIKKEVLVEDVLVSRSIPTKYISNDDVKIEIHKKIDKLKDTSSLLELKNELIDRFGHLDEEINYYMYEKLYQYLIKENDIVNVINNKTEITLVFSIERTKTLDGNKIFTIANEISSDLKLHYGDKKISINLNKRALKNKNDYLIILCKYLEKILNS